MTYKTEEGFEHLYNLYAEQMYIICYNKIDNKEVAKGIVQNIFKSLWERRGKLTITGSIEHYLFRAVKLETITYYRKKSVQAKSRKVILEKSPISDNYTEDILDYEELSSLVNILIEKLPSRCREVFKLKHYEGLSNKEIASTLIISTKTVEAHVTKALGFLKLNLEEYQI
ncbi:MAG: RNA polymerase sigma-70 factor [Flavobacteriaceae bacterium]